MLSAKSMHVVMIEVTGQIYIVRKRAVQNWRFNFFIGRVCLISLDHSRLSDFKPVLLLLSIQQTLNKLSAVGRK